MDRKRRNNNLANKIGAKEDDVNGDVVNQATQTLSASSVTSMSIMQRNANRLSVLVVIRLNIL